MRTSFVVVTAIAILGGAHGGHTVAARCSKGAMLQFGPRYGRMVYVLGSARRDTVLAGRGDVEYRPGDGHFGRGDERPIHGQLFTVDRIGTPDTASVPSGVTTAVIVPWDYGADCYPSPWSRSAAWLPSERGVVIGNLRERQFWVRGMPTIDVHMPEAQPYPQRVTRGASTDSVLTADELFVFLEALPNVEEFEESPREPYLAFRRWTRANPRIAERWPASYAVQTLKYHAEMGLMRKLVPPITGTFRFTLTRPGRDSTVFFVRTYRHATSQWRPERVQPESDSTVQAPSSYYVLVAIAPSLNELPVSAGNRATDREGYFAMVHEPQLRPGGFRNWEGRIELGSSSKALLGDLIVTEPDDASNALGLFTMDPQGRLRAEMTIGHAGGQPVVARGERISTTTVDSKWF